MTELVSYRDRFPILAKTTYLINHSLGAMPAAAEERLLEYAHMWRTRGIRSWEEGWWDLPLTIGDQMARLIGAPPGTVSMHQLREVDAFDVLHCQIITRADSAGVVSLHDVGVGQLADGENLALEAADDFTIRQQVFADDFHSRDPLHEWMTGLEDLPAAATTEPFEHDVRTQ